MKTTNKGTTMNNISDKLKYINKTHPYKRTKKTFAQVLAEAEKRQNVKAPTIY